MSDPYLVIKYDDGQITLDQLRLGTKLHDLEDLWQPAWEDRACRYGDGERIRVGLTHGLALRTSTPLEPSEADKLKIEWLGYRDTVGANDAGEDETDAVDEVDATDEIDPDYLKQRADEVRAAHEVAAELDEVHGRSRNKTRKTAAELKAARIKVGRILLEVRAARGGPERGPNAKWWGDFVYSAGINPRTARRYMKAAEVSDSVRKKTPNPDHVLIAADRFRKLVTKAVREWPETQRQTVLPGMLRDLADELEAERRSIEIEAEVNKRMVVIGDLSEFADAPSTQLQLDGVSP